MSTETITSLQNPRVKNVVKLRDRRARETQQRIVVDGLREISRALDSGLQGVEAFICRPFCASEAAHAVLDQLARLSVPVVEVSRDVMTKMAFGERAEGVLIVAETPNRGLTDLSPSADALVAVLEGVEKPGNLGAVLRSADGAGVSAVIVADGLTDLYNPNAIRASLGTIFSMPVCSATSAETLTWLEQHRFAVFATRVDGEQLYTQADLTGRAAIVLGSEAHGLSPAWSGPNVQPIKLPMQGVADSLNVSAAAAILFYETLRQRMRA